MEDTLYQAQPAWLIGAIQKAYGEGALDIIAASMQRAPLCLRVNRLRNSVDAYQTKLTAANIAWQPGLHEEGVVLTEAQPARSLPGWQDGDVAIQDHGALYAAHILLEQARARIKGQVTKDNPSLRILDACAAPGGNSFI